MQIRRRLLFPCAYACDKFSSKTPQGPGVVVRWKHVGGVKVFKMAIFEDQHLSGAELHSRLDELVERACSSGWQPTVKSFSRRSGKRTYIYAKAEGNDMKLLLVAWNQMKRW